MLKVRNQGREWLEQALAELKQRQDFNHLTMPDLLNYLFDSGKKVSVLYINGHWLDINVLDDIGRASDFTLGN